IWPLPKASLEKVFKYSAVFGAAVSALIVLLVSLVPAFYEGGKYYADYVMGRHGDEVHAVMDLKAEGLKEPVYGTLGYTTAGLMEYHSGEHYLTFKLIDNNGRN